MSNSVRPHRPQPTRLPCPWYSPGKNTGVGWHFLLQCMKVKVKSLSHVWLLVTPWTAACPAPPSMGFYRQECWSGLPLPSLEPKEKWDQFCFSLFLNLLKFLFVIWDLFLFFFFIHSFFRISGGKGNESLPWKGNRHLSRKANIFIFKEK